LNVSISSKDDHQKQFLCKHINILIDIKSATSHPYKQTACAKCYKLPFKQPFFHASSSFSSMKWQSFQPDIFQATWTCAESWNWSWRRHTNLV